MYAQGNVIYNAQGRARQCSRLSKQVLLLLTRGYGPDACCRKLAQLDSARALHKYLLRNGSKQSLVEISIFRQVSERAKVEN